MAGLSPKLPLTYSGPHGYALNKEFAELISQNLKMLVLTSPGERLMDVNYGVGVKRFLFESNSVPTRGRISDEIMTAVSTYLSYIDIIDIEISGVDEYNNISNLVNIKITYNVPALSLTDQTEILLS